MWGQQRHQQPQQPIRQEDFAALPGAPPPPQTQLFLLPPAPQLKAATRPPVPQPLHTILPPTTQPEPPRDALLITADMLYEFAKELSTSVARTIAQTFTQISGVTIDLTAMESMVSTLAEKVTAVIIKTHCLQLTTVSSTHQAPAQPKICHMEQGDGTPAFTHP